MSGSLDDFCREEFGRLVGLLSLYCGDRHVAEELAQETLVRLCRDWSKVRRMDHPGAWASRVALNFANSYFRRRKAEARARERLERTTVAPHAGPGPETAIAVKDALTSLPKRQRAVLLLHYYGDLSLREVARALEMPEGTVKSLARRGVQRLRRESDALRLREVFDAR